MQLEEPNSLFEKEYQLHERINFKLFIWVLTETSQGIFFRVDLYALAVSDDVTPRLLFYKRVSDPFDPSRWVHQRILPLVPHLFMPYRQRSALRIVLHQKMHNTLGHFVHKFSHDNLFSNYLSCFRLESKNKVFKNT